MKLTIIISALAILFGSISLEVQAAKKILIEKSENWILYVSESGETVFKGKLEDESVNAVINYLKSKGKNRKSLMISSTGGKSEPGIKLGQFIFDHKITVTIDEICASSCAYFVLPASSKVSFTKNTIIGLHEAPTKKYFKYLEALLNHERMKTVTSITQEQRLKAIENLANYVKELLPMIESYYAHIGLETNTLIHVTHVDNSVKKRLKKHNQKLQAKPFKSKVMIVPDLKFLENCLGYNISSWSGYTQEPTDKASKKTKLVLLKNGNYIFENEVIAKTNYQNCFRKQNKT